MYLAPDVVPDPVPVAAAIGITLDCWRHTEIEDLHAGSTTLTDVVMAKLSIITTRTVRAHITSQGIDWDAVAGVLLDPERRLYDGRAVLHLIGEPNWPKVRASIQAKLDRWTHVEQLAGPEATLRLVSVMGSTDYTARWWGNGWWPELSGQVLSHVEYRFPRLLDPEPDDPMPFGYPSEVASHPEYLTDAFLNAQIDPPDNDGLRYADLPDIPRHDLKLADGAEGVGGLVRRPAASTDSATSATGSRGDGGY